MCVAAVHADGSSSFDGHVLSGLQAQRLHSYCAPSFPTSASPTNRTRFGRFWLISADSALIKGSLSCKGTVHVCTTGRCLAAQVPLVGQHMLETLSPETITQSACIHAHQHDSTGWPKVTMCAPACGRQCPQGRHRRHLASLAQWRLLQHLSDPCHSRGQRAARAAGCSAFSAVRLRPICTLKQRVTQSRWQLCVSTSGASTLVYDEQKCATLQQIRSEVCG